MQRGLSQEDAVALIVNGFAREVLSSCRWSFAVEAQKLLGIQLEGRWLAAPRSSRRSWGPTVNGWIRGTTELKNECFKIENSTPKSTASRSSRA
jgi:hypothetical protein